jgi:hypothetical protein
MPSRYLPEQGRAAEQHMLRMDRRIRLIERGRQVKHHKMAEGDDLVTTTNQTVTALTLTVGPGAWLLDGRCNISYSTTLATEAATVGIRGIVSSTEEDLGIVGPSQVWSWKGAASAVAVIQPMAPVAHLSTSLAVKLHLEIALLSGGASHAVTLTGLWLHATPL